MYIRNLILAVALLAAHLAISQNLYYKLKDKPVMSESFFDKVKKSYASIGEFKVKTISTETRNDSIIKNVAFELVKLNQNNEKSASPFAKHEAKIGQHFPIEIFNTSDKTLFTADALKGKPSIVNFWFTRCMPCIEEIPILNALKKEFGDSVNFIAITFDSKEMADAFLLKKNIDFQHITNSRKQLDQLEVNAYPMNLILDKDGNIKEVSGNFDDKKEIIKNIKKLL